MSYQFVQSVRQFIKSPTFPVWRLIAFLVEVPSQWRLTRVARSSIRYNRWRHRLAQLGDQTVIYPYVVIHSPEHVSIGRNVAIAEFVHIWGGGGVAIGDNVLIAAHAVITSQSHDSAAESRRNNIVRPVLIEENVWIGAGAIILPGIVIGRDAVIAAGAVVTTNVSPSCVVAGVPARVINCLENPASDC